MKKKITIDELRLCIVEQIKEKLNTSTDHWFGFYDDEVNVVLTTGQSVPCVYVKLHEHGNPLFGISLVGIRDFELGYNDITVDSLDTINKIIKIDRHTMDIYSTNDGDHVLLYNHVISALPENDEEAFSYLNEIVTPGVSSSGWKRFDHDRYVFALYPDPNDKDRYLVAHFD